MLRRVYCRWQPWATAFACVMVMGYAAVAQDDAGSAPKQDAEQEPAAPAEPQDDTTAPSDDPAPPEAKPDAPPAAEETAKEDAGAEAKDADASKQAKPVPADETTEEIERQLAIAAGICRRIDAFGHPDGSAFLHARQRCLIR